MTEENGYQSGLQGCSPGIGAAINCDLPLVNVVDTWSKIDGAGLHRSRDAGTGAITPYHDRKSRATRTIQAGEVSWYIICSTMYEFIRLLNSTFATPTFCFEGIVYRLRRELLLYPTENIRVDALA